AGRRSRTRRPRTSSGGDDVRRGDDRTRAAHFVAVARTPLRHGLSSCKRRATTGGRKASRGVPRERPAAAPAVGHGGTRVSELAVGRGASTRLISPTPAVR